MTNITEVKSYIIYMPLSQHTALKVYAAKRNLTIAQVFKTFLDTLLKGEDNG